MNEVTEKGSFPRKFPEYAFRPAPPAEQSVSLTAFPVTLDPARVNCTVSVGEYAFPAGRLVRVLSARSTGPVFFEDRDTVRIQWRVIAGGKTVSRFVHWLDPGENADRLSVFLRDVQPEQGTPFIEDLDLWIPRTLALGFERQVEDVQIRGIRTGRGIFKERIDAAGQVILGTETFDCLRFITEISGLEDRKTECYIDLQTGLPVLQRLLIDSSDGTSVCTVCRIPYYHFPETGQGEDPA
jgi:hypothetical protein